jgi:adenylate kinase family enzyme
VKKVAVFGKPGSGKSVLSDALSVKTAIELFQLDSIMYDHDGNPVDRNIYDERHEAILNSECWVIDGLGPLKSFYQRIEAADTLVYINLPYAVSYWLVTKRLLKSVFVKPAGWPEGSSVWKGTLQSYKTLKRCPEFWNEDFLNKIEAMASSKSVFVIRTIAELNSFVDRHV